MKILSKNNGEANMLASLIVFISLFSVITFFVVIAGVFKVNNDLSNVADTVIRSAELSGHTNLQTQADILRSQTGLDFKLSWEGTEYISGTKKVQLNNDIYLHLSVPYSVKIGNFPLFEVMINVRRTGTSEIYYK